MADSAEVFLTGRFSTYTSNVTVTLHCENQCEALEIYNISGMPFLSYLG
jgi:hypothetical protein